MIYRTCLTCGANNDPGERCDCQRQEIRNDPQIDQREERQDGKHIQAHIPKETDRR